MPILRRLNEYSHSLEELLIGGLLATASVILFANVVARYIFNWGVPGQMNSFVMRLSGWCLLAAA